MRQIDISFRIAGEAGQGVESSGAGFAKALTRAGLHVFALPDYYSRIRGGHNFFTVRVSDQPLYATREKIHLLLALNAESVARHVDSLVPGGAVIVDETVKVDEEALNGADVHLLRMPLTQIAEREGNALMANTATLAAAAGLTSFDLRYIIGVVEDNFKRKGGDVVEANRRVAHSAHDLAREQFGDMFPWKLTPQEAPRRLSINSNEAFAMGALMAGCKFVAGYPMTPATPVLSYMAQHAAEWGLVVKHAESEIAAVNMVVGAGVAGVRAMAPTSGGGFDLMTEGLSLAAMTETPVVIYLAQRPGPATGLPTRTAQGDLFLALHTSHGEFSRIVLAPHTAEEHWQCAVRAFNLAEKYQCTVIVLSDHYTTGAVQVVDAERLDPSQIQIERGKLLRAAALQGLRDYKRYALTDDGISPRALPGSPQAVYLTTGDEHDEAGHITEDMGLAKAMAEKRLRKEQVALGEMRPPIQFGPQAAELTFVSWGSTYGPLREAVELLNTEGRSANLVHFVDLWPFPAEAAHGALSSARRLVDVEGNATAQFATLLRTYAGIDIQQRILRYDGRGFTPDYILAHLEGK